MAVTCETSQVVAGYLKMAPGSEKKSTKMDTKMVNHFSLFY